MSIDRFLGDGTRITDNIPRCRKSTFKLFMGKHRKPIYEDEQDAIEVVDTLFGGERVKFVKDYGDLFRVVRLSPR
jgi:hypothetical protein